VVCIKVLWKFRFKLCGNFKFYRHLVEHENMTVISCELICKDFIICFVSHCTVIINVVVGFFISFVLCCFKCFAVFYSHCMFYQFTVLNVVFLN